MNFRKISSLIIILVFILVISSFFWTNLLQIRDAPKSETRNLMPMPILKPSLSSISFSREYGKYFSDNFPLRYRMIRLNHQIRYTVFQEKFYPNVIIGDEGWLYSNDAASTDICQNLKQWGSFDPYTEQAQMTRQFLLDKGIDFAIVFLPEKCRIYPEYIETVLPKFSSISSSEQLIEHLSTNSDVTVINLTEGLMAGKDQELMFFKTDTHWSSVGAYSGYKQIITTLFPDIPRKELVSWDPASETLPKERKGDLGAMTGLPEFAREFGFPPNFSILDSQKLDKGEVLYNNPQPTSNQTLLVFHDSYFRVSPIREFLASHYQTAVFLDINRGFRWSNNQAYLEDVIAQWDPDTIIVAYVERNIPVLKRE